MCGAKLARSPEFYQAYYERGVAYERSHRFAQALRDYRSASAAAPPGSDVGGEAERGAERLKTVVEIGGG